MSSRRRIRVVMIIQSYLPLIGGAERQIAALGPLLQEMNVDVHVLTRQYEGLSSYEVINGVPVHRVPIVRSKAVAAALFITHSLLKIRSLKPDLLHAHELLSPSTVAILGKWWLHLPVLAKVLRSGQIGDLAKLGTGLLRRWRVNFLVNNINAFAIISREIDAELSSIGVPEEQRVFLPNGVDTARFQPALNEEKKLLREQMNLPNEYVVVYSGRLQPEKRVDQLILAWKQLQTQEIDALLIIVGTGPEESRLHRLAGDKVRFIGAVEDVVPYLKASDVYVLPSSTEGLSNSLLEAMACGLPVIATNVGGAQDLIVNGTRGLLISPDSSIEIYDALLRMLKDQSLRSRCGKGAREYVVRNYSLPKMATRMRDLYDALLERRSPLLKPHLKREQ